MGSSETTIPRPDRVPRRAFAVAAIALVLVVVFAAAGAVMLRRGSSEPAASVTSLVPPPPGSTLPIPPRRHVWLLVLENKDDGVIIGQPDAPYLNSLIGMGSVVEDFQAVAHPSQPNYLALVSGSTQGVTDDLVHTVTGPSLFDQIETAGKTWRVAAENVPDGCFDGATATGGPDGPGTYARKHDPAISFSSISGDPARCANIGNLSSFQPGAADFQLIIPNMCHDMHDCSVAEGDAWLRTFLPTITDDPAFQDDGLLLITFDEGEHGDQDNDVATIALGPGIKPGFTSSVPHSHYSLLHTIQGALGLPCLAATCEANTLGELFTPTGPS